MHSYWIRYFNFVTVQCSILHLKNFNTYLPIYLYVPSAPDLSFIARFPLFCLDFSIFSLLLNSVKLLCFHVYSSCILILAFLFTFPISGFILFTSFAHHFSSVWLFLFVCLISFPRFLLLLLCASFFTLYIFFPVSSAHFWHILIFFIKGFFFSNILLFTTTAQFDLDLSLFFQCLLDWFLYLHRLFFFLCFLFPFTSYWLFSSSSLNIVISVFTIFTSSSYPRSHFYKRWYTFTSRRYFCNHFSMSSSLHNDTCRLDMFYSGFFKLQDHVTDIHNRATAVEPHRIVFFSA